MNELSIFVDESGDFGVYDYRSPYYIISLVLHEQNNDIQSDLNRLESELNYLGLPDHCVHAGPIIRSENEYKELSLEDRRKILKTLMKFIRHINISFKTIFVEKKHLCNPSEINGKLRKQLVEFVKEKREWFSKFDLVKIYYDNGQIEITRILFSAFNTELENVEFRKVIPSQYRLFRWLI